MRIVALALLCTLALLGSSAPAEAARSPRYSPRSGLVFNNPRGTAGQKLAIITTLNRSIDVAPKGSTIRMAQFLFDIDSTAKKLVAAHRRGVNVQMIIDSKPSPQTKLLIRELKQNRRAKSFVVRCTASCMAGGTSVMHAKFFMFSTAGDAKLVSMISSANPYTGNTFNSWNNLHTIVGNRTIYRSLKKYFVDMLADKNQPNYFRATVSGKTKLYFFPRRAKAGSNKIPLLNELRHVSCTGAAKGYGRNGRTVIRVANWGWTSRRRDVADQIWKLHNRGCVVEVIENSGRSNQRLIRSLLRRSPKHGYIPVYDAWVDRNRDGTGEYYNHHKVLTVNGVWFGHKNMKIVYTGSQNLSGVGVVANNDILMRVHDDRTYNAYNRQLNLIRDKYTKNVTASVLVARRGVAEPPTADSDGTSSGHPSDEVESVLDR